MLDIRKTILDAGALLLSARHNKMHEETKTGPKDFVTEYDLEVQEMLFTALKSDCPEMVLIGEETKSPDIPKTGPFCVIDPIDGTANFIHGVKKSCISVAIGKGGQIIEGYVYDPYLDEMFHAVLGQGAFVNKKRLIRSNDVDIASSLVCFGTSPYDENLARDTFRAAELIFFKSLDVRRTGSAALDLCYIADNRFDLFFEGSLSPWDHAAASLIAKEAGAMCCAIDESPLSLTKKSSVVAGSKIAVEEFLELIRSEKLFCYM